MEWVARYYTKLPDELAKGVEKKLTQKTRTSTAKTFGSSHAAFLNSLQWIWKKHQLLHGGEMPEHVARALSNSSCHSKSGDTDLDACAEAMRCLELGLRQRSLESAEEGHAKKGAKAEASAGLEQSANDETQRSPAQPTLRATSSHATGKGFAAGKKKTTRSKATASGQKRPGKAAAGPAKKAAKSTSSSSSSSSSSAESEWVSDETPGAAAAFGTTAAFGTSRSSSAQPTVRAGASKAGESSTSAAAHATSKGSATGLEAAALRCPLLENTHAAPPKLAELFRLSGGKEDLTQYNRVPLCGGKPKCFFMASAIGKIMQQQSQVPTAEKMQLFSNGNKASHLAWVKKKISENACFPEDGPPLSLSLQCATGLLQNEYLEELGKGNLLGGWLEASIMASRWNCIICVYFSEKSVTFGGNGKNPRINLLWTGDHYELLLPRARDDSSKPARPKKIEAQEKNHAGSAQCNALGSGGR